MTGRIACNGGSPPRRALVQPALPLVSITQPTGRGSFEFSPNHPSPLRSVTVAGSLTRANLMESTMTASNGTDKSEGSSASENAGATTLTDTAPAKEPLIVDGSRRISILPRSASMGNIGGLRSAAGSRGSDHPRASHSAVQSVAIEDPFLSAISDRQVLTSSTTPPKPDRVQVIQAVKTPEQDLSPRQDRLGQEVTPANAQGVHTPAACVFMANLSAQRTLEQLEHSVAEAMKIYGTCYIKVQFDKNKMPYCLIQFENEEDARLCLTNACGLVIDGRPIRVEPARAHRAVYLCKITGGLVGDDEAREVLGRFGAIEETCQTTVADQEMHGLPEGCWVKFRYFMDCKDAISCFRNNEYYKLMVQEKSSEPGHRGSSVSPSLHRGANRGFRHGSDAKAIFVGGLPEAVTEEQLRQVFLPYGNILDCKVVRKSLGGNQINIFAFIEFRTVTEAQAAQNAQFSIGNVPLRIEPKRYTMRRAARHQLNHSPITFASPSYQSPVYHSNVNRANYDNNYPPIYNHGTSMGYTNNNSPHVLPMRSGPPPHYGNTSNMSPYTQYPSPHYTSPLAPRGAGTFNMSSPSPMNLSSGDPPPPPPPPPAYYGSYMVGGPGGYNMGMGMGPGVMQPIAEHADEMVPLGGPGVF